MLHHDTSTYNQNRKSVKSILPKHIHDWEHQTSTTRITNTKSYSTFALVLLQITFSLINYIKYYIFHIMIKSGQNKKWNIQIKAYLTQQFLQTSGSHSLSAAKHGHWRLRHWLLAQWQPLNRFLQLLGHLDEQVKLN